MSPIPWATILRHAPTLVASAARLMATADQSKVRRQNETIEARFNQLEKASDDSAQLLQEMAEQVQALAAAHEQTTRRYRTAMALAIAALVIGIVAGILAVAW
jgi:hypothetical protein